MNLNGWSSSQKNHGENRKKSQQSYHNWIVLLLLWTSQPNYKRKSATDNIAKKKLIVQSTIMERKFIHHSSECIDRVCWVSLSDSIEMVCVCVRLAFHISISVVKQIFGFRSNSLSFDFVIRTTTISNFGGCCRWLWIKFQCIAPMKMWTIVCECD